VPIYFHAKIVVYFTCYLVALFALQNCLQRFSVKTSGIKVRIGKPISVAEQNEHVSLESYSEFLRKKTYMLANPFEKQITDDSSLKLPKAQKK
jgi:hypothetical protein